MLIGDIHAYHARWVAVEHHGAHGPCFGRLGHDLVELASGLIAVVYPEHAPRVVVVGHGLDIQDIFYPGVAHHSRLARELVDGVEIAIVGYGIERACSVASQGVEALLQCSNLGAVAVLGVDDEKVHLTVHDSYGIHRRCSVVVGHVHDIDCGSNGGDGSPRCRVEHYKLCRNTIVGCSEAIHPPVEILGGIEQVIVGCYFLYIFGCLGNIGVEPEQSSIVVGAPPEGV